MSRIDRIRDYIETVASNKGAAFQGVDTGEIADALSIWRTDVSALLNRLCESGALIKKSGKPVKYFPAYYEQNTVKEDQQNETDVAPDRDAAFSSLAGCRGSLKVQIETAKAAVLYPPSGLHTLIIGETGVGKSLFAEEMWRFAVQQKKTTINSSSETPYVVFNCAEYADNPQLLLSQLFGHAKGAFTGAKEDKPGLVELADGGILFLDEIHRLPHTGQEIFFMLLDRGEYRRLGDSANRTASVMIIGATSEDPASTLLSTFKRRMPVLIQIPNLSRRSLHERLNLISLFLFQESNRLECSIFVSGSALQVLSSYKPKANIGDLRSDLQLCCARSYLSHRLSNRTSSKDRTISIDIPDLPQRVYLATSDREIPTWVLSEKEFTSGLIIHPGKTPPRYNDTEIDTPLDLYGFIEQQRSFYIKKNFPADKIENLSIEAIEKYLTKTSSAFLDSGAVNDSRFRDMITTTVWELSNKLLEKASKQLNRVYTENIRISLAMHFQQFVDRSNSGKIIYNPNIRYIQSTYPKELAFLEKHIDLISEQLVITPSVDELCFIAMFLRKPADSFPPSVHVGLVVAAHGDSMATSIADFTNQVLQINIVRAVNIPLKKDMEEVFREICRAVLSADKGLGVLLLADTESFAFLQNRIVLQTGVQCQIFHNTNSLIVLEAARNVLSSEMTLKDAFRELFNFSKHFYHQILINNRKLEQALNGSLLQEEDYNSVPVILIICSTGIGTALKLKDLLIDRIPTASTAEIFTASVLDNITSITNNFKSRLCMIIGSIDPCIDKIPFFNADAVLHKKNLSEIESCLQNWHSISIPEKKYDALQDESILELLSQNVDRFAPSLPKDTVLQQAQYIIDRLESSIYFKGTFSPDVTVRTYMHIMTLFERLALGDIADKSELHDLEQERNPDIFTEMSLIMEDACRPLGLTFPESETYYMIISLPAPVCSGSSRST